MPGNIPRRAGAGPRLQVNKEVLLGKVGLVGASRHPGNQGPSRVGEGLPGIAVAVGGVAQGLLHRHTGNGLTPFHQFQGPQVVRSVAGQYLHGRDQFRCPPQSPPCAPNRRLLLLWPWRIWGSCTDTIRSLLPRPSGRFLRRRAPLLEQQLPQQLRRRHDALSLRAALRQFTLRLPRRFQQRSASATIVASNALRALRSDQSTVSPLMLDPRYRS